MKAKEISAQDYNALPRKDKRALERSLKKQGLETPEINERVHLGVTVDKELYIKGLEVLGRNKIDTTRFIDLAFQNLILSEK